MMANAPISIEVENDQLFKALGKALVQWQGIEMYLGLIFAGVVNARDQVSANAAFHSIISFDAKLGMTDSAIAASFKNTLVWAAWKPLRNCAERRNDRRNQLAHFTLGIHPKRKPGNRSHLRPSVLDLKALLKWGTQQPEINIAQIAESGDSFEKLGVDLAGFYADWVQPRVVKPS